MTVSRMITGLESTATIHIPSSRAIVLSALKRGTGTEVGIVA